MMGKMSLINLEQSVGSESFDLMDISKHQLVDIMADKKHGVLHIRTYIKPSHQLSMTSAENTTYDFKKHWHS